MNFRTHLEIIALEPQANGMTVIEAQAPDGTRVALVLRVVEPLALGGHLELALTGEPVAEKPATSALRSRVQAPGAAGITTRSASQVSATSAPTSGNAVGAAASPGAATSTPQGPSATGDASSLLLSTILGESPPSAAAMERDVNDEMDALFGAPRKRKG